MGLQRVRHDWVTSLSIANQPRLKYNVLSNLHFQISQLINSILDPQVTALSTRSYSCFLCCFPSLTMKPSVWFQSPESLLLPATAEISLEISHSPIYSGLLGKLELGGSLNKEIWCQTVCKNKTSQSWRRMTEVTKHRWNEWFITGEVT